MNAEIVSLARRWIGTPYLHQAAMRGAGCDCAGLLRGIWREVYGTDVEGVPAYTPDWAEPQREEYLHATVARLFRTAGPGPWQHGQILLFRMRAGAIAKHVGVLALDGTAPSFVHAYSGHGVVESPLSAPWQRRIVARFEFDQGE